MTSTESDDPQSEEEARSSIFLQSLLTQAAEGDKEASEAIYVKYAQNLIELASCRISTIFNSKIEPEDIVQSVFRSFFQRNKKQTLQLRNWEELWSFLVTVTIRKCSAKANWYLRQKRDVNKEFSNSTSNRGEVKIDVASPLPTPHQIAVFDDLVSQLFEPLDETQREIVLMRMQGYTNKEISKELERTERTIYRVLEMLREKMQQIQDTETE